MDTCKGIKGCVIAKRLKLKKVEECPNHVQNVFTNDKDEKILVEDCVPIRTMLMLQEMQGRVYGMHKSFNQQRNRSETVLNFIGTAFKQAIARQDRKVINIEEEE